MTQRLRTHPRFPARGFALVVVMSLLMLLLILVVGLLSLSSIALRSASLSTYEVRARTNARLALMLALGDLQRQAGPDTRATAAASLLGTDGVQHPHWTGVWSTRATDGRPLFSRDDKAGGLSDTRATAADREKLTLGWLVSGAAANPAVNPRNSIAENPVKLVGPGSLGVDAVVTNEVSVPQVAINTGAEQRGHYAWWVGDLGIKANIATPDAFEGKQPDPGDPATGGWFRLMTSQEADASAIAEPARLDASKKRLLASETTPALLKAKAAAPADRHFHDFTTHSEGLLTDMANGGLKRDLTAYFQSKGTIADRDGLPGLSDRDNLVGPANASAAERDGIRWLVTRHHFTSPRFGLLRRWANTAAPFRERDFNAIPPKPEPAPHTSASKDLALANQKPTSIAAADTPNIAPVLVEGSLFFNMSWHRASPPPGQTTAPHPFQVRLHIYPRFVLWNPYNVKLTLDRCLGMIQGNGRQEMWTDAYLPLGNSKLPLDPVQWIWTEGGRNNNFSGSILESAGYTDPYNGCFYFAIPRTTFGPGECLVFSPDKSAEYNRPLRPDSKNYALEKNTLTCLKPPHPSRSYYTSDSEIGGGIDFIPTAFWFAPITAFNSEGIKNQADDCRVILKQLGSSSSNVLFEDFDTLPQLALLSASLQYGGGREPRISWSVNEKMVVEETGTTDVAAQPLKIPPNVRTREGIRLRWFDEHQSNLENTGSLRNTPFFEDALLANWNPRAAYVTRSPFENIGGSMPSSGTLGGPWFFGAYTRDLYDGAVSWGDQMPVLRDARYHGNPFGPPQEGGGKPIVLFDIPREGTGVLSIGQLQHAKLSEFIWHPSYAVGQSLADPRLASGQLSGLDRTAPPYAGSAEAQKGGFDATAIGWSGDAQRSANRESWATQGRAIFQDYPESDNLVYDLSFELNQSLWDPFFLSTGDSQAKQQFLTDPAGLPLPNGRMRPAPLTGPRATAEDLADFHRSAYALCVDGAFNVNSTSVEAWKAVLGATRRLSTDGKSAAFPRVLSPPGGQWSSNDSADADAAWSGNRTLNDDEIDRLARAIVVEVRKRGPFLSLADFVNRRLANDETGRMGALQAAIEAAHLNGSFQDAYPLDNAKSLPDYNHPDNIKDATRMEQTLKPDCKAWGIPGYLTQGDLLQVLGPMLSARSDTFIIRGYGDAADASGKIQARVWCEAIVQRCPEPISADPSGTNSANLGKPSDMGRRFVVKSFRWLRPEEV
jgi:Tfp pilus assembly protein PilV